MPLDNNIGRQRQNHTDELLAKQAERNRAYDEPQRGACVTERDTCVTSRDMGVTERDAYANRATGYGSTIGLPKTPYPTEKISSGYGDFPPPLNRLNMACNHIQDLEGMIIRLQEKLLGPQPETTQSKCPDYAPNPWGGHQGELGNMAESIIQATVRMGNMLVAIEKTLP